MDNVNKKVLAWLFAFPLIALFAWTVSLYAQQATGREITVAIQGYDPRDLLSGHYISYTIDWHRTDCDQFFNGACPRKEFCKEARWGRQCRFYIPEANAKELDDLFRRRNSTDRVFEVVYSYKRGSEPMAKQLLINGKDWRESLKKNTEPETK